jgi:hypothetical protein
VLQKSGAEPPRKAVRLSFVILVLSN